MTNKQKVFTVIFIEVSEFGQFEITTDVNNSVKNHLKTMTEYDKLYEKEYLDYDNNSDFYNNDNIYYKKEFKTLELAENHIKYLQSILDSHIHPVYCLAYCGLREYLESINYWKN